MRYFRPEFSVGFLRFFETLPEARDKEIHAVASLEVARAAARLRREEGLLVVGIDLAGQEKGYPAMDHRKAYQVAHEAFLGKTVHAGEDYGPESIFQAIGDLHADRIGHGTWLFDATKIKNPRITDPKRYVEDLAEYIADKRITIEVCLTSNQQTVPELADDLRKHPFAEMRRRRLSTTFCTDNRLVSHTTVSAGDRPRGRGVRPPGPRGARHPDLRLQAQLLPRHLPREARLRPRRHRLREPGPGPDSDLASFLMRRDRSRNASVLTRSVAVSVAVLFPLLFPLPFPFPFRFLLSVVSEPSVRSVLTTGETPDGLPSPPRRRRGT